MKRKRSTPKKTSRTPATRSRKAKPKAKAKTTARRRLRYAVIGLGHISQQAVLPGFEHSSENSELCALISGDRAKLKAMGKEYGIEQLYHYDEFDECLETLGLHCRT